MLQYGHKKKILILWDVVMQRFGVCVDERLESFGRVVHVVEEHLQTSVMKTKLTRETGRYNKKRNFRKV